MRKFPIALTALFMFGGAAHAQCTPEGMARFNANGAQLDAVAARIKAGDCSLIPEWKRLFAVRHAIQHRSQLQTTPYTCRVDIKSPPGPPLWHRDSEGGANANGSAFAAARRSGAARCCSTTAE